MSIYISGSIAYDRIMTFQGKFTDSIIPDKVHKMSISFMVDRMEEKFGGCSGNIAYTLALLGEAPRAFVLSQVGKDFAPYATHMQELGLPLDGITQDSELFTALCYITTDLDNNQITGFYPGSMSLPCRFGFPKLNKNTDIGIVSPGNLTDMRAMPEYYKNNNIPYIYDPGQQLPVISAEELIQGISGSLALVTNDYELEMICKKTNKSETEICALTTWCITTLGEKGARIIGEGKSFTIPPVPVKQVIDPTGAGDAHRGGLLKGLYNGYDIVESCQIAATAASYAIEHYGTQLHNFTSKDFMQRYENTYGKLSKNLFS